MRKSSWIWFAGFAAWMVDMAVNLHLHNWVHAKLAFTLAAVFLAAGVFYRRMG